MKKLVVFCLFLSFIFSISAQVSSFVKISETGKITPCMTIFGSKPIVDKLGMTYFALVQSSWSEAQLGLSYKPVSWSSFGLSFGMEQLNGGISPRTGCSLWLGKNKTSFVFLGEKGVGSTNYWYKSTLSYSLSKNFNLGVRGWRFTGFGPIVEYKVGDIKFWGVEAYDIEEKMMKSVIGFDVRI